MALTDAQYYQHFHTLMVDIIAGEIADDPAVIRRMMRYFRRPGGTAAQRTDRREAARRALRELFIASGHTHNAHEMKHWMHRAGVPDAIEIP